MFYFAYPIKDTYIYELNDNSEKNFGSDDTLVLKKDVDGLTGINGVSRILLQFDLSGLSQSIVEGDTAGTNFYLRLFEKKSSELSNTYSLSAFPLSQSWEGGSGYTTQNPNIRDGVSWVRKDESFNNTNWSSSFVNISNSDSNRYELLSGTVTASNGSNQISGSGTSLTSLKSGDHIKIVNGSTSQIFNVSEVKSNVSMSINGNWSGVNINSASIFRNNSFGGGIWLKDYGCSQTFTNQSPDVEMDITTMVNNWLDGTIENNGLILMWSGSQESSGDITGDINFFSFDSDSVYSPRIESRDTVAPYSTTLTALTNDGTKDNQLYMINLKEVYSENENPKFRVGGRERYIVKSTSTTPSINYTKHSGIQKGFYSIVDVETGQTIIPFTANISEHTNFLSADNTSNYFKLNLKSFIKNRNYKILLKLKDANNQERIFDDNWIFRVES